MNHNQLMNLYNGLQLGTLLAEPKRIHCELLHQMWLINTEEASYAIKQLSHDIDLAYASIVQLDHIIPE